SNGAIAGRDPDRADKKKFFLSPEFLYVSEQACSKKGNKWSEILAEAYIVQPSSLHM
ncbi:hypothetical protein EBI_24229, partial [Enterocytozoon bieneusi H348]